MVTPLRSEFYVWQYAARRVYGTPADPMPPVWRPTRLACTTLRMRVDLACAFRIHPLPPEERPW